MKSGVIDVAIFSGILHHLENQQIVIADTVRTLVSGGRFLGIENNSSAFRFIFDFLMRRKRLWNEKAHEAHFIVNRKELQRWFGQAPHLLNFFHVARVEWLIRATDAVCQRLPWLNLQGGLILFAGRKVPGDGNAS